MDEGAAGRPTPIHITKYDGSFRACWPAWFVRRAGPLYVVAQRQGDLVLSPPSPGEEPMEWPLLWVADTYLWDDRWYNVSRVLRDGRTWYYVNIATPAKFDGEAFSYIDLDLDVEWYTDEAEPRVLDEDEFLLHSETMGYPPSVVESARAAVDDVLTLMRTRAFPFDSP